MPTPAEIKEEFPLPENLVKLKADRDDMIKKYLQVNLISFY